MISYDTGGVNLFFNLFTVHGSVFPKALFFSVPSSCITAIFIWAIHDKGMFAYFLDKESVMNNNAIWGGFSFLVGFLVVFRTSQAYSRFWEGCTQTHKMGAEWFDACSSLMAFCMHSDADQDLILCFQNLLVRLFSMLHAAALGEIEEGSGENSYESTRAFNMELIDAGSINEDSMSSFIESDAKVELIFQWIQQLIVINIRTEVLSIPPPILSRSFQEIAAGMVHFHEAMKISTVPFPFPYAQTCDALLFLHWLIVPFIVSQWVTTPWFAALFCFIQVFTLWTLNLIAVELENPFGTDPNDIDGESMQLAMNTSLRLLLKESTKSIPRLEMVGTNQQGLVAKAVEEGESARKSTLANCLSNIDYPCKVSGSARRKYTADCGRKHPSRNRISLESASEVCASSLEMQRPKDKTVQKRSVSATSASFGTTPTFAPTLEPAKVICVDEASERPPAWDAHGPVELLAEPVDQIVEGAAGGRWEPLCPNGFAAPQRPELRFESDLARSGLPDDTASRLVEIFRQIEPVNPEDISDPDRQIDISFLRDRTVRPI